MRNQRNEVQGAKSWSHFKSYGGGGKNFMTPKLELNLWKKHNKGESKVLREISLRTLGESGSYDTNSCDIIYGRPLQRKKPVATVTENECDVELTRPLHVEVRVRISSIVRTRLVAAFPSFEIVSPTTPGPRWESVQRQRHCAEQINFTIMDS